MTGLQANIQHLLCSLNASQLLQMSNVFSSEITDEKIVQIVSFQNIYIYVIDTIS